MDHMGGVLVHAKQLADGLRIGHVKFVKMEAFLISYFGNTRPFQSGIVIGVQVIHANDVIATIQQCPANMETDEAGGASDNDFHAAGLSRP